MDYSNLIILFVLAISPFLYLPYIVTKKQRKNNSFTWIIVTILLGLAQCLCFLMILFFLDITL